MTYTTNEKGEIGEAAFQLWCAKKQYFCGKAPEKAPYDFFLDKNDGKILRVQVKYRTPNKDGRIELKFRPTDSKNNKYFNYSSANIDAIVIYNSVSDELALIPSADFPSDQTYVFLLCRDSKRGEASRSFASYKI